MNTLRSPMRLGGVASWPLLLSRGNTLTTGPTDERLKMPVFSVSSGLIATMEPQHFCRSCRFFRTWGSVATKAPFSLSSTWNRKENLPGAPFTFEVAWRLYTPSPETMSGSVGGEKTFNFNLRIVPRALDAKLS